MLRKIYLSKNTPENSLYFILFIYSFFKVGVMYSYKLINAYVYARVHKLIIKDKRFQHFSSTDSVFDAIITESIPKVSYQVRYVEFYV